MKKIAIIFTMMLFVFGEELQVIESLKAPYQLGDDAITTFKSLKTPKSIILIIADGTGIGQYTLSYYANNNFAPSRFDHVGLVVTHPDDGLKKVTDSASSGTAMATGAKTYNGAISVDKEGNAIKTAMEIAKEFNYSTGVIATSTVTHATPASFIAHIDSRSKEGEIARQMARSNTDLIFGGGEKYWTDDVISILNEHNGQLIREIDAPYDPSKRVVGLFDHGALNPHTEGRNPTTTQMAKRALDIFDRKAKGFFLMIEESQIDWGGHSNNADYIRGEMESLNDLVNMCLNYQEKHKDVLVVLTSDHECGGVSIHDAENGNLDVRYTSDYHSANFVPIFATGPGAEFFDAMIDNTTIGKQLIKYIKND